MKCQTTLAKKLEKQESLFCKYFGYCENSKWYFGEKPQFNVLRDKKRKEAAVKLAEVIQKNCLKAYLIPLKYEFIIHHHRF